MSLALHLETLETPTGRLLLVTDDARCLRAVDWDDCAERMRRLLRRHYGEAVPRPVTRNTEATAAPARDALARYFAGDLQACRDLVVATNGTPFQQRVWAALRRIPVGTTLTYGRLAAQVGIPQGARAVGLANGGNPIAIVVPCHRVIGADGALTGFGGGIARKRWLLAHERMSAADSDR